MLRQRHLMEVPPSMLDWKSLYTPCTLQRMESYEAMRATRQNTEGTYIINLGQNPNSPGSGASSLIPCILTSPLIYSFTKGRHLCPEELMCVQGLVGLSIGDFQIPWFSAFKAMPKQTKLRLAGNAMHAEVVTSILCYGLSIARKYRTFAFPHCDLPLMDVEFEGEGSDEPEPRMEPPTAARSPGEVAAHPACEPDSH